MRFILLTLVRRQEAVKAVWADVDFKKKLWQIPETKNGKPHEVPLSTQAVALLEEIGVGEPNEPLFPTRKGTMLGNWDRETKVLQKVSDTTSWHRHDLRRTGATMLGKMEVPPDFVEAVLNHGPIHSPLAAAYNQARYLSTQRIALQQLADKLDELATEGEAQQGDAGAAS